jgi:hypothetical protein
MNKIKIKKKKEQVMFLSLSVMQRRWQQLSNRPFACTNRNALTTNHKREELKAVENKRCRV